MRGLLRMLTIGSACVFVALALIYLFAAAGIYMSATSFAATALVLICAAFAGTIVDALWLYWIVAERRDA